MSVLVLGTGRSGSTMLVTALAQSPDLQNNNQLFDEKDITSQSLVQHLNDKSFVCKTNTAYFFNDINSFHNTLNRAQNTKVVFIVRHPYDMAMSKVYRGRQHPEAASPFHINEADFQYCWLQIKWMTCVYDYVKLNSSVIDLTYVKMEDLILDFENTMKDVSNFCGIQYDDKMADFCNFYKNKDKASRYSNIDKSQIDMWKRIDTVYDGHFNGDSEFKSFLRTLNPIAEKFGYETGDIKRGIIHIK